MALPGPDDDITCVTEDGEETVKAYKFVAKSDTIKKLIEEAGADDPVPLPGIPTKARFEKVLVYCEYLVTLDEKTPPETPPKINKPLSSVIMSEITD